MAFGINWGMCTARDATCRRFAAGFPGRRLGKCVEAKARWCASVIAGCPPKLIDSHSTSPIVTSMRSLWTETQAQSSSRRTPLNLYVAARYVALSCVLFALLAYTTVQIFSHRFLFPVICVPAEQILRDKLGAYPRQPGRYASSTVEAASVVGAVLGERAKQRGIENVYWRRPGKYHGKIKAFVDAFRECGIKTCTPPPDAMPRAPQQVPGIISRRMLRPLRPHNLVDAAE